MKGRYWHCQKITKPVKMLSQGANNGVLHQMGLNGTMNGYVLGNVSKPLILPRDNNGVFAPDEFIDGPKRLGVDQKGYIWTKSAKHELKILRDAFSIFMHFCCR